MRNFVRNGIVERNLDFYIFGNKVLDLSEQFEVVLGHDVFRIGSIKACYKATERGDTYSLADTKHSYGGTVESIICALHEMYAYRYQYE
jgi:hypothetical protein